MSAIYKNGTWYGNGGSSGAGGHIISDGTTDYTEREKLSFSDDFEVSDNSTGDSTDIEEHKLTSAEWDAIFETTPTKNLCGFTPVGTVISVMGNSAPKNYVVCDGTIYNMSKYPALANYFEVQFGSKNHFGGNGTTTFGVPDLRGEFLRGTGTNSHAYNGNGANVGVHQDSTVINTFNSTATSTSIYHLQGKTNDLYMGGTCDSLFQAYNNNGTVTRQAAGTDTIKAVTTTGSETNTSLTTNVGAVRPTNTSVLYCIAVADIYIDARFDYSTDEKIVGTWIDGKPLYQRTFVDTFGTVTDGTVLSKSIEDLGSTISVHNIYGFCNGTPIGCWGASTQYFFRVCLQGTVLTAECNRSVMSNKLIKATIQYTKSTD